MIEEITEMQLAAADAVNSRRFAWFQIALHISRVDLLAQKNIVLQETLAQLWLSLAKAAPYLKTTMPNNMV